MSKGGNAPLRRLALAKQQQEPRSAASDEDFSPSMSGVFERLRTAHKEKKGTRKKIKQPIEPISLARDETVEKKHLSDDEIEQLIEEKLNERLAKIKEKKEEKKEEDKKEELAVEVDESPKSEGITLDPSEKETHLDASGAEIKEGAEQEKPDLMELQKVNEVFPLIKLRKDGKEQTYVWGNIRWVTQVNALRYLVKEPPLSDKETKVLTEIKNILERKLDVQFKTVKSESAFDYLRKQAETIQKKIGLKLTENQKMKFEYFLYRDFIGLSEIEPLMHDQDIEDISCDGSNIPIFIYHRNPKYAGIETNVMFKTSDDIDSFVLKLAQKVGRSISIAEPLLDGALPDGSRVQATYGSDIARRGSNFTIRKFTSEPITPIKEIEFGTINPEILAYLWLAMENGLSILISGATATGKTSLLNAISLFIKGEAKIVSIEDTPELRLPQPNWVPQVARSGFGREAYGEVSMFDLLKASLRQRPDYVIVGEVRGKEANVMFQGMATGHASLGTLHADSFNAVYDRLTTRPINLPSSMLENLDLIVFLSITRRGGAYLRKVKEVVEVIEYDLDTNKLKTNIAFRWDPLTDQFVSQKSVLLEKMKEKMGLGTQEVLHELSDRVRVIRWLHKKGLKDFENFARYIQKYYADKKSLLQEIERG